jgi:hypothetical protein
MQGRIDPKAMVWVRRYLQLRARIETDCPALFVAEEDGAKNSRNGKIRETGCRVCGGMAPAMR